MIQGLGIILSHEPESTLFNMSAGYLSHYRSYQTATSNRVTGTYTTANTLTSTGFPQGTSTYNASKYIVGVDTK